jgi:hypothetical protein
MKNCKVVLVPGLRAYRESRGIAPLYLISALDGRERLTSHPGRFCLGKGPRYPLRGGWVCPGAGLGPN